MTSLKTALEEILGRHQRYGLTSVCAGDHGTWTQWPCETARLAKAMMGRLGQLENAWDRMDRARGLLKDRGEWSNWGMLDTTLDREALAHAAQELNKGEVR